MCVICCEGKQSRLPFKNKGNRAATLLEVVLVDWCGLMEANSLDVSKYFVLILVEWRLNIFYRVKMAYIWTIK